ncbi:ATP-binding cassette domain-containing protein, partial [Micrococcus luteus]|uniref:ATP-binding cassette domain-containing protein n=1 Tax=Micrococcus luteus TaxID=1270 RepID=UPI001F0E3C07
RQGEVARGGRRLRRVVLGDRAAHRHAAVDPQRGDGGLEVVATLNDAVFRQGGFTLGPVSRQVNAGERIGITGPNGAGKSTLLRGLLGRQAPDEGAAALGSSVQIGEIDQARSLLAGTVPLAAAVEALVPEMASGEVRTLLAKFGLRADHVNRPVDELSPGERTRASLALLQARGVNVLVLDEPTNQLEALRAMRGRTCQDQSPDELCRAHPRSVFKGPSQTCRAKVRGAR